MSLLDQLNIWLAAQNFPLICQDKAARKGFEAGWAAKEAEHLEKMRAMHREQLESFRAFRAFVASADAVTDTLNNFRDFSAGWLCRKKATYRASKLSEDFSPKWLVQKSRLFQAGWHSRRIAELNTALKGCYHVTIRDVGWEKARAREEAKLDRLRYLPGFAWGGMTPACRRLDVAWAARLVSRTQVREPELPCGLNFGCPNPDSCRKFGGCFNEPEEPESFLDAGIPTG